MIGRVIMDRKVRNKLGEKGKLGKMLPSDWREFGKIGRVIIDRKMRNKLNKKGKTGEDVTK